MDRIGLLLAISITSPALPGQGLSPAARPAFEVASIKENNLPGQNSVQFGPDTLTIIHLPLVNILIQAYDLPPDQMSFGRFEPLFAQRYDIVAKAGSRVRRDRMARMLQTLLADRFHLAVHHEQKLVQGYTLLVDKDGPRLRPPAAPDEEAAFDKRMDARAPGQSIQFKHATMDLLARILTEAAGMSKLRQGPSPMIVNMNGIQGGFDFTLGWMREAVTSGDGDPPEKLPAIVEGLHKLGLTVKSQKVPIDILVVDHVDKTPTAN